MTEDERPRPSTPAHEIGQGLDTLSLRDFDERLALLRAEIARLEAARDQKRAALDAAGAIFTRR